MIFRAKTKATLGVALLSLLALILAACGDPTVTTAPAAAPTTIKATAATASTIVAPTTGASSTSAAPAKKLKVVTTVAPLTNIVQNVGGVRIDVHGIIPDGTDSHTFEPAPSDSKFMADADLIIVNGLHLEDPTLKLANSAKKPNTPILYLGDNTITEQDWLFDFSFPKDKGDPNPHLWMNPKYAMNYAKVTRDQLVKIDPEGKTYYDKNLELYMAQLQSLYDGIKTAAQTVPADQRRLLTYHDSWAYWAREYNWQVLGAIQPSDFKEPSAKEVADLITQIKKEKVKAIFGSEVFPSPILEQIAKESGAKFIDQLRDDEPPGKAGDPQHSYVGMLLEDMKIMFEALGGNVDALKNVAPNDTYQK